MDIPKKRVALCFWGQPRFIENPATYEGIKKHLLSNPNYQIDIYVHTWFSENGIMVGSNWSGINHTMNPKTLDYIYDRYRNNLKRLIWSAQPNFLLDPRFTGLREQMQANMHVASCMLPDKNFDALCSQSVSTSAVINMVQQNIVDKYDWIILMRQDCCLLDLPDLTTLDPEKLYCVYSAPNSIKDDCFIFNPKYAKIFDLVDALQTYQVTSNFIPNAEHIRYSHATKYIGRENIVSMNHIYGEIHKVIRSYE